MLDYRLPDQILVSLEDLKLQFLGEPAIFTLKLLKLILPNRHAIEVIQSFEQEFRPLSEHHGIVPNHCFFA